MKRARVSNSGDESAESKRDDPSAVDKLRQEVQALRSELQDVREELSQTQEKRQNAALEAYEVLEWTHRWLQQTLKALERKDGSRLTRPALADDFRRTLRCVFEDLSAAREELDDCY